MKKLMLTGMLAAVLVLPMVGVQAAQPSRSTFHVTYTMMPGSEASPNAAGGSFGKQWMVDHSTPNDCKPPVTKFKDTGNVIACVTVVKTVVANVALDLNHHKVVIDA